MKSTKGKKIAALILSAAMTGTVFSVLPSVSAAEVDISNDFESNTDGWGPRGENETVSISTDKAHSGESSMCVADREASWNGPSFALDGIIEAGEEYMVTAYAMTEWYSTLTLSKQYDDSEGTTHYDNILAANNDGSNWTEYKDIKFSFPAGSTNMSIYFEASDAGTKIYVDDFSLTTAPDIAIEENIPSLKSAFANDFKIGTAITPSDIASKPFMKLVDKHFSESITVGNELKPDYVLDKAACLAYFEENGDDTNPQVTLASARPVLDYCLENNIPVRGHTLVWHSQTPAWFFKEGYADDGDWVSKEKMIERMENYIKNVMETIAKEYPDLNVYAWDVVNEAWTDNGTPRTAGTNNNGDGTSGWVQIFGDNSFIEYAFTFARKYAPEGTMLYYNDYNEYIDGKTNAIYEMAMDLKEKGLIDGIGMQSHLDVGFPSASQYKKALEKFVSTGLDIQVTELDITTSKTPTEADLEKQAEVYKDIFQALLDNKDSISAVILWGVTDDKSWRASQYPLLFDSEYMAKPAFYSVAELGDGEEPPATESTETTSEPVETTVSESETIETTVSESETIETTVSESETENTESESAADTSEIISDATMLGDATGDGIVDIRDVTMICQHIVKMQTLEGSLFANADIQTDGTVDVKDLSQLKKYLINDIDKL
ncbi:MAG: endo-1,4-beta-xylanase [Oscillospiraceae bacterium]